MHEGHKDQTLMLWPWRHGSFCWLLKEQRGYSWGLEGQDWALQKAGKRNGGKAPTDAPKTVCLKGGDRTEWLWRGEGLSLVGTSLLLRGQG